MMTFEPERVKSTNGQAKSREAVRLTFRSSSDYWGESLSFAINGKLHPQVQSSHAANFRSLAVLPEGKSLLWIGKIIRRAQGEDEVMFRVYDEDENFDVTEPATWHIGSRGLSLDASLDLVLLSSAGSAPRIVDELRIGSTWRSVVPSFDGKLSKQQESQ